MDIVLGVSMAPSAVRMVLVEGENADGVTVDQDDFDVDCGDAATIVSGGPDQVIAAILGTREGAHEGGYHLTSTGVTFSDQAQAAVLRDALADRKVENVMLVSAFLAAAALAQAVGNATRYARTGLLFVEPRAATLAVVDSADGSIVEVQRRALSGDDDTAMTELTALVADAEALSARPDGLFVVGSGVNVAMIKPALEVATTLPVSAPEEPEMALARGAALASAHAPLFESSTRAVAWAQDPGTGAVHPGLISLGAPVDYEATQGDGALAYSALRDETGSVYLADAGMPADDPQLVDSRLLNFSTEAVQHGHKSFLLAGSGLATLFVVGVAALVISLAVSIRPTADQRPEPGQNIVVPSQQAAPPPPAAPAPAPAAPAPAPPPETIPQPLPAAHQGPAPAPAAPPPAPAAPAPIAPAPPPAAPAPAPAPPPVIAPVPIPIPIHVPAPAPKAPAPAAPAPQWPLPDLKIPGLPDFDPPKQSPPGHDGGGNQGGWPGGGHDSGGGNNSGIPGLPGGGSNNGGGKGGGHDGGWPGLGGGGGWPNNGGGGGGHKGGGGHGGGGGGGWPGFGGGGGGWPGLGGGGGHGGGKGGGWPF